MKTSTLVVLGLLGAAGWYWYQSQNSYTDAHGRTWKLTQSSDGLPTLRLAGNPHA